MKKIIFCTHQIEKAGGIVRVVNMWANYFAKNNYDVEIIATGIEKPYYDFDQKIKRKKWNFEFKHKLIGIPYNLFQTFRLLNHLKNRKNLNLIVDRAIHVEPIWILRKIGLYKKMNIIYFAHGGSSDFRDFYMNRPMVRHKPKMIFEAFDNVICLYDDETDYPPQVKKEKLHFVPNPLPFEPSNITFEEKENTVLSIGRVTKEKGIDTLIKAWVNIEVKFPDWKLQIVGDGKDKEEFIKLAKALNLKNIDFLPAATDVKPYYEKAKIFVIPSLFEGMPMTILEAMSCKCCVVSSKTAGGVKLIDDKVTGYLFGIGDAKALCRQVEDLIENNKNTNQVALGGHEYIRQYKIDKIAKKWKDILI